MKVFNQLSVNNHRLLEKTLTGYHGHSCLMGERVAYIASMSQVCIKTEVKIRILNIDFFHASSLHLGFRRNTIFLC